jgi:hypothetical protein
MVLSNVGALQVASPSAERRVLVAEMIAGLLDPRPLLAASTPHVSTSSLPSTPAASASHLLPCLSFGSTGGPTVQDIHQPQQQQQQQLPHMPAAANGTSAAFYQHQPQQGGDGPAASLPSPLIDCAGHAAALLGAVCKLAEDRMEQVGW